MAPMLSDAPGITRIAAAPVKTPVCVISLLIKGWHGLREFVATRRTDAERGALGTMSVRPRKQASDVCWVVALVCLRGFTLIMRRR
jgi:hypothetical protein